MQVEVRGNTDIDFQRALTEFKRRVKKAGIMEDLRKHEYYVKPSLKKKLKRLDATKRRKREESLKRKEKRNRHENS